MSRIASENVNTNPEPKIRVKLPNPIVKDSHQHHAGKVANAFAGAKTETFQGGFFEPDKSEL
jgi:hypothetical protein